jgi:CheY-like chemotaxis protein
MPRALSSSMRDRKKNITDQQGRTMQNKRILIVEDDMTLTHSISFTLKRHRYAVTTLRSAREALRTILSQEEGKRNVDLLITDIQLPDMTGAELIDELVSRDALPPTLVMTAYATNELFETLKKKGVRQCLAKPFDINELVRLVSSQLPL